MDEETLLEVAELLHGSAQVIKGADLDDDELAVQAARHFPGKGFCIVRQWMLIDVEVSEASRVELDAAGIKPTILYSHAVSWDSKGRFRPGEWERSTYQISYDGYFFETKNTVYVLAGRGFRKSASGRAVLALG